MPAIVTPPATKPRHDIGEGGHGSGRRPPTDKHTGGGGDGDNWSDRPVGARGPRERLAQYRIGLLFALVGDMLFFVAIVSAFLVTKSSYHFDAYSHYINSWLPTSVPSILWLNTGVLLLSSITAELARRSMFREAELMDEWIGFGKPTSQRAAAWLSITLVLGVCFLAGQWIAWNQLHAEHVFFASNPSSHFFYLITAAHALHLFLGLTALIAALIGLRTSRQLATRQIMVDTTVWYWHAMGFLWIFLFILLEFFQ